MAVSLSPVVNCVDIEDRDSGCICIPLVMIILMYSGWRAETHPSVNKTKQGIITLLPVVM